MSTEAAEFIVGDFSFKVQALKLKPSQRGLALVAGVLIPAFAGMATLTPAGLQAAIQGLDTLPELYDLFAGVTQVEWQGKYVSLATFQDNVFSRRMDLMLGYVAECVHAEYSSFLDANGKAVLAQAASRFGFLLESIGPSGE